MALNLANAISVIESCAGVTDYTTPVGEAWNVVLSEIEQLCKKVDQLSDELKSINEAADICMDEACTADEVHCTCVPLLRTRVQQLQQVLYAARQFVALTPPPDTVDQKWWLDRLSSYTDDRNILEQKLAEAVATADGRDDVLEN